MSRVNRDVRLKIWGSGLRFWQVADRLGIAAETFSRKLRKELSKEEKEKIFNIIETLSKEVV